MTRKTPQTVAASILRNALYLRDGKNCHYCGIPEDEVLLIWPTQFYGKNNRGRKLEISRLNPELEYEIDNCVLACTICNVSKSDKFTPEEFVKVGETIREIWQARKEKQPL